MGHVVAVIGEGAAALASANNAAPARQSGARRASKGRGNQARAPLSNDPPLLSNRHAKQRLTAPPATDRLLISPKARKEAARRGIDLSQLAKLGKGQPYHVADLDQLQKEIASPAPASVAANIMEFGATVDIEPTLSLAEWIGKETGKPIALDAVWAAFAGGSLGGGTRRIRLHTLRGSQDYVVAPYQGLSQIVPAADASDAVDLIIHDLSEFTIVASAHRFGSRSVPDARCRSIDWQDDPDAAR